MAREVHDPPVLLVQRDLDPLGLAPEQGGGRAVATVVEQFGDACSFAPRPVKLREEPAQRAQVRVADHQRVVPFRALDTLAEAPGCQLADEPATHRQGLATTVAAVGHAVAQQLPRDGGGGRIQHQLGAPPVRRLILQPVRQQQFEQGAPDLLVIAFLADQLAREALDACKRNAVVQPFGPGQVAIGVKQQLGAAAVGDPDRADRNPRPLAVHRFGIGAAPAPFVGGQGVGHGEAPPQLAIQRNRVACRLLRLDRPVFEQFDEIERAQPDPCVESRIGKPFAGVTVTAQDGRN